MISRAIKEHQAKNSGRREELEALRKSAIAGADGVSNEIVDILNSGYVAIALLCHWFSYVECTELVIDC
jgi:hypothetical protein